MLRKRCRKTAGGTLFGLRLEMARGFMLQLLLTCGESVAQTYICNHAKHRQTYIYMHVLEALTSNFVNSCMIQNSHLLSLEFNPSWFFSLTFLAQSQKCKVCMLVKKHTL